MRRLPLILGLALIVAMTIREVYEFLVTNEGVRYFSSEPKRLLYVILLGAVGGLVALWISRLSPGFQRRLKLAALGAFGVFLTGGLAFFGLVIATTAPVVREAGMFWWVIAGLLGMSIAAGLVWLEFRQEWRRS
jgi:H+/Cl- antiporter ClcA